MQMHSLRVVLFKHCREKFCQIHKELPEMASFLKKVAGRSSFLQKTQFQVLSCDFTEIFYNGCNGYWIEHL